MFSSYNHKYQEMSINPFYKPNHEYNGIRNFKKVI